jgi:hypothetical protein
LNAGSRNSRDSRLPHPNESPRPIARPAPIGSRNLIPRSKDQGLSSSPFTPAGWRQHAAGLPVQVGLPGRPAATCLFHASYGDGQYDRSSAARVTSSIRSGLVRAASESGDRFPRGMPRAASRHQSGSQPAKTGNNEESPGRS